MLSEEETKNLEIVRRYIDLFSNPSTKSEDIRAMVDETVVWREMPNRFAPSGRVSDLKTGGGNFDRGREHLPEQTYTVTNQIACGDTVVLELTWTGKVARAIGPFAAGTELTAQVAMFLRLRGGKIISQTDYICYAPG